MSDEQRDLFDDSDVCFFCERAATLLCDGRIAALSLDGKHYHEPDEPGNWLTCDRPMCRHCAHYAGPIFFDGTNPDGSRWGEIETRDFCAQCMAEGRHRERPELASAERLAELRAERLDRSRVRRMYAVQDSPCA